MTPRCHLHDARTVYSRSSIFPNWSFPVHALTRRRVLQQLAAISIVPVVGCGGSGPVGALDDGVQIPTLPVPGTRFLHGVASGDPLPDRVILWTRVTPPEDFADTALAVRWQVAEDEAMTGLIGEGVVFAERSTDWTVKLDAVGLQPGSTYFYRFLVGELASPVGRTRTTALGSVERLRLAVVTCSDFARGLFNAYDRIAEREDLDAVIHLGDYIYETDGLNRFRANVPPVRCVTLADYRGRWANHRLDAGLAECHRKNPWIWAWDDHESANNSWVGGAGGHNEERDGPWSARVAAAVQAAHEWMPVRTPNPADLTELYRAFRFGDLVDLFMLETRLNGRDEQIPENTPVGEGLPAFTQTGAFADPNRQMLGGPQEQWLREGLRASAARWRLLGNQTVFSPLKVAGLPREAGGGLYANPDQWDGYEPARDRVLEMIANSQGDVVILTGDVHAGLAFDVTPDPNNPLVYNPLTQSGAVAVEFVTPSISSAGDPGGFSTDPEDLLEAVIVNNPEILQAPNPHARYVNTLQNGYLILDLRPEELRAEFWTVPSVEQPTSEENLDAVFLVEHGVSRLQRV
jgi:alkaline phosphatase D